MRAALVLTTVPDRRTAGKLAKVLIQRKAAACVSFSGGWTSVYRWKGKSQSSKEVVLLIKSPASKFAVLSRLITAHHPYGIPEIIKINLSEISKPYLKWMEESLS